MVKIKKIIMVALLLVIGPFTFVSNVQAANQYGYPEAIYNGSMSRWEADLSQSPLYEGTQDMQFYNYPYWSQDPVSKNMIYNTRSFNPGVGGYNSVGIQYPSDNGSWRAVYLLYVGPVKVQYLEVGTNNVLLPVNYVAGEGGATYNIQSEQIPGYQLDHVQGSESGTFNFLGADYGSAGNPNLSASVTYFYKKVALGADVTVTYVDELGNEVSAPETLTGNVGDSYTSTQKTISGYTFKEVQGSVTGTFTDSPQTVTYVYTKDKVAGANVTVKYVDESGNEVSAPEILSGNVGEAYTSTQKTVSGYTFKEVQGSATGTFTDSPQTVTYVYTKDEVIVPTINIDNTNKIIKNYQSINYRSSLKQINKNYSSEKSILPETGEDKNISIFMIITGLALMSGASMLLINRFRKNK